jgi:hypothetical protein
MSEPITPNDDWLEEGVAENLRAAAAPAPRGDFPTPPTGKGLAPAKPKAPERPRSLAGLGINTRGGVIKESGAPVVHRTELHNPVNNPKPQPDQRIGKASIVDSGDFTPEFGVPSLMTGMDANFEQRASDLARQAVLPAAPNELEAAPTAPTGDTTLRELLRMAKANEGRLELGGTHFTLEIQLR